MDDPDFVGIILKVKLLQLTQRRQWNLLEPYFPSTSQASMGDVFAWYTRTLAALGRKRETIYSELERKAKKLRPGQTGLLALDWLNGCRTPLVDAKLSGMIVGLTLSTTAEEIYRSLLEATAFGTNLIIETFEKCRIRVDEVYACGGLAEKNWKKAEATTKEWLHAFARLKVPAEEFLATYDSNHIHGCYGNWVEELKTVCEILGVEYKVYA